MPGRTPPQSRQDLEYLHNDVTEHGKLFIRDLHKEVPQLFRLLQHYLRIMYHISHTPVSDQPVPWPAALWSALLRSADTQPRLYSYDFQEEHTAEGLQEVRRILETIVFQHIQPDQKEDLEEQEETGSSSLALTEANLAAHTLRHRQSSASTASISTAQRSYVKGKKRITLPPGAFVGKY